MPWEWWSGCNQPSKLVCKVPLSPWRHELTTNRCTNGNAGAGATPISVTYDKAGVSGINVGSNKSIIGIGSKGVIRGKGLRMANGVQNVIIQFAISTYPLQSITDNA